MWYKHSRHNVAINSTLQRVAVAVDVRRRESLPPPQAARWEWIRATRDWCAPVGPNTRSPSRSPSPNCVHSWPGEKAPVRRTATDIPQLWGCATSRAVRRCVGRRAWAGRSPPRQCSCGAERWRIQRCSPWRLCRDHWKIGWAHFRQVKVFSTAVGCVCNIQAACPQTHSCLPLFSRRSLFSFPWVRVGAARLQFPAPNKTASLICSGGVSALPHSRRSGYMHERNYKWHVQHSIPHLNSSCLVCQQKL